MAIRPLIGMPCAPMLRADTSSLVYACNPNYAHAIEEAGGVPVLLPLWERPESLQALRGHLDGLLLMGGGDIDPVHYGQQPIRQTQPPELARDTLEMELTRDALDEGLPVLGICRGMQLLNVARGGTLYQDIAYQLPAAQPHVLGGTGMDRLHDIEVRRGSRLARILGDERHAVNSFHHQAVNVLGDGLTIVAWTDDGVAEAVEVEGHPFALAVQFHPERMYEHDPAVRHLFEAFVAACQARIAEHAG
jgi:putative glutamine amidotransferase